MYKESTTQSPAIWWLHPAALVCSAGVFIGVCAYLIPESTYRRYWRTPKFFDLHGLWVTLACCGVFAVGAVLGARILGRAPRLNPSGSLADKIPWDAMEKLFKISFYLCLLGYALWIGLAIQRGMTPETVVGVLAGEKGAMYDARFTYLPTVGGITTLTQFGTAAVILGAVIGFCRGWRTVRIKLAILLFAAVCRALINSERFALIELIVPFAIVALGFRYLSYSKVAVRARMLMNLAPVIAVVALLLFFTSFEYLRSWSNYYAGRDQSLWEFGAMRLVGYYVTSFNNGAYFLNRLPPLNAPYFTTHFLWTFPLTSPAIKRLFPDPMLDTTDKWFYFPFLESDANVEFNNADGMLFPLMDFGIAGGLIYWTAAGFVCGWLYERFRRKDLSGLLIATPMLFWLVRRVGAGSRLPSGRLSYEVS